MKRSMLFLVMIITLAPLSQLWAQTAPLSVSDLQKDIQAGAEKAGQPSGQAQESGDYTRYRMEEELNRRILALSVIGAGIASLLLVLNFLKAREAPPDTVVNGSGLVLVIFATVLIVILAKVDQQLTAATGILGAIAGYLFGKSTKTGDTEEKLGRSGSP